VTENDQSRWRLLLGGLVAGTALQAGLAAPSLGQEFQTTTPIRHVVVIFQENTSFDHYFGTYPTATNLAGETAFVPFAATPTVNGLAGNRPNVGVTAPSVVGGLLTDNRNTVAPFRLDRINAVTCDQNHGYTAEQQAVDSGLLDHFALASGAGGTSVTGPGCTDAKGNDLPGYAMAYYDGNTVTALWNYAQYFAINDNSFGTTFGPSTPGAINLISGQTHGAVPSPGGGGVVSDGNGGFTLDGDADSALDDCGNPTSNVAMTDPKFAHTNVGDLLNAQGITWGWFGGGFAPSTPAAAGARAVCGTTTIAHLFAPAPPPLNLSETQVPEVEYVAHHTPFQYYTSTANPHHLPPSSTASIGFTDQANHQYDLSLFFTAVAAGNLPAVSFLKGTTAGDGHPTNSDPLTEQDFIVTTVNAIEQSPFWADTAIIIAWDDSDGWYDHVTGPIVNASASAADAFVGGKSCGTPAAGAYAGRCGYGPRLPLLVISPWAKQNYVDHNLTDQTSVLLFIEQNWNLGFIDGPAAPPKGQGSFDRIAGQINGMFDFDARPRAQTVILDPGNGLVVPQ
jgi:phospholipase C